MSYAEFVKKDYFDTGISREFFDLLVGDRIGYGSSRQVYSCLTDAAHVIKFETSAGSFQNVKEWDLWERAEWTLLKKWLAPCSYISSCGSILIQKKCAPVTIAELKRVKKIPALFSDLKVSNWGKLDGRIVCFDYGSNLILEKSGLLKMKVPKWSDK